MALIDRETPAVKKEQVNVRVDPEVAQMLRSYCEFIESGQHYVVEQALQFTFRKDKEFQAWLRRNGSTRQERKDRAEKAVGASGS